MNDRLTDIRLVNGSDMAEVAGIIGQYGGASMETRSCKQCDLKYDKSKEQYWLVCCLCEDAYDIGCQGIPKTDFKTIKKRNDTFWLCPNCLPQFKKDDLTRPNQTTTKIQEGIEQIRRMTEELTTQQESIEKTIRKMEGKFNPEDLETRIKGVDNNLADKIQSVQKTIDEVPKLWSEVAKNPPQTQPGITMEQVKKALYEVASYEKDQEMRAKGIVVYRLVESEKSTITERKREDEEAIKELLKFIGCDEHEVTYVERLGRFDEGRIKERKYRPVKVRFTNKEARDEVLNSLHRLKYAPEGIKVLSIRQDLNETQRNELRDIMAKAINLTKQSETTFYRVKGGPGNYKLVELEKK